jgi:RNA polymerase sigma-70 factor, ECF subfamily
VKPADAIGWSEIATSEAALIERCLAGDEAANATLVFEHHRLVLGLATHLLGDREEALDLSQEVYLRVFRTLHRFRGQSSLRTWIFRIVVNQVRNRQRWWRRRARSKQVSLDEHIREHGEMVLGADARTPDRELARKELGRRLKLALQHLPFEQRTALVLREVEGLRYEEIAFSLGLPVGTVKSRLTRARQALREELGDLRC